MGAPTVYLCDLRYNYSGVLANDCMPLGVAYMKAVMDKELPEVRSRLFAYPDRLYDAIRETPPDVLMLSNYCWNEALSIHLAKLAKRVKPDMLVVLGGPNISIEAERQQEYLAGMPDVDLYLLGEGDFLAAEIVRHFLDSGMSIRALGEREIPSSLYRRPDGTVHRTAPWDRHRNIDEIPSPWLTGVLDEFFDSKLAPIMETNRGCPFTCTFCCQGTGWYTKVNYFGLERLRDEIFYVARKIKELSPYMRTLRIADSNYGMFERDAEISGYLGETQRDYGWPTYIDATTGKNRPDRIIKSIEKVNGAMLMYQAVQSLDENVLRNVKRSTIKMEAYEQLRVYMRGRGLRSNTDLILGLPGETLETHMNGIRKLLDAGLNQVTNFQLMMLKGTELETVESRKLFHFRSGFRILPKNFGVYGDEKVFDVEEIVCATDTLPFDDYLKARIAALASSAFYHDNYFEKVVDFVGTLGIKRSEWMDAVLEGMENSDGKVREFLDGFVSETINELFPSREACIEYYSKDENFAKLQRGDVGDNLMHKYRAIASFHIWPDICACAMEATRKLLVERNLQSRVPDFDAFWADFHRYIDLGHANGYTKADILAEVQAEMSYDIAGWLEAGSPVDPTPFRLPEPTLAYYRLDRECASELHAALQSWSDSLKGLSKLVTRIQVVWQQRRCHLAAASEEQVAAVAG
ncbi:MAG: cobalamin-dependent protein [Acidobacteria bacterium]|nr:cobalamin-dependent protein [Acidobacteriota bacterium]